MQIGEGQRQYLKRNFHSPLFVNNIEFLVFFSPPHLTNIHIISANAVKKNRSFVNTRKSHRKYFHPCRNLISLQKDKQGRLCFYQDQCQDKWRLNAPFTANFAVLIFAMTSNWYIGAAGWIRKKHTRAYKTEKKC